MEFDHADIYRDAEVEGAFRLFANLVPRNGLLITGIESERARRVGEAAVSPVETFAAEGEADWTAEVLESGASGTRFRLRRRPLETQKRVSRSIQLEPTDCSGPRYSPGRRQRIVTEQSGLVTRTAGISRARSQFHPGSNRADPARPLLGVWWTWAP